MVRQREKWYKILETNGIHLFLETNRNDMFERMRHLFLQTQTGDLDKRNDMFATGFYDTHL